MKWNIFSPDTMFKRIFRYLLKRYFGQYLEDFSQDQLSYGFSHGKGSVENVRLNVESLNELSDEYNLPVEFLQGSIDTVSIFVPWTHLLRENSIIELKGLRLIVKPKERPDDASVFDSMWSSMASSLQLAEECLNSKGEEDEDFDVPDRSEGLEKIAKAIDAVLANMKIKFHDSSIRIEHIPDVESSGSALEIKIGQSEYFDESGVNISSMDGNNESITYEPQSYSIKKFILENVSLFTTEFMIKSRTCFEKIAVPANMESFPFVPGSPEMPPTHSSFPVKKSEQELQDEPILISKLSGQQELRIKLKQNESVVGPKVDVEFNLGAFNMFLTPQQVHILCEVVYGVLRPSSDKEPVRKVPLSVTNKPMKAADYALVEQELLRQQQKADAPSKSLKNQPGWSSHSFDLESEEDFQLMTTENKFAHLDSPPSLVNDNESMYSSVSSDARSDNTGLFSGNSQRMRSRSSTVTQMLQDQLSELTHFSGCIRNCCIIILHDDSVQESLSNNSRGVSKQNSFAALKLRAETFFEDLAYLQMSGIDFRDFNAIRDPLSELCEANHLRFLASSITIDGNERSSSAQHILNYTMSFFQFELLECLFNSANLENEPQPLSYVQMLTCVPTNTPTGDQEQNRSSFRVKYQSIEYTSQNRNITPPANKLDFHFGALSCELDISITDRIQTLLNFQNLFKQSISRNDDWKTYDMASMTRSSLKTDLSISSPFLTVNLRFPIPDLRSIHDMDRMPWWQQNLRKDILRLELKDVTFATTFDGNETKSKYEIQCRDLHGLWKHSTEEDPISFLRVSVDPDIDEVTQNDGFDWPRLVIHKSTYVPNSAFEVGMEEHEELISYSVSDVLIQNLESELSPFSSTSVAYDSKLQKRKEDRGTHQEVIKPADKKTILYFKDQIVGKSECLLEFKLCSVNICFPSKDFFELIYNRIGNDFLLWERTILAPKSSYNPNGFEVHVPGLDFSTHNIFDSEYGRPPNFMPFPNDSKGDSDEEEPIHRSFYEHCERQRQKLKKQSNSNALTKLTLSFAITKGMLTIHTPILDNSYQPIPDVCGKLQLYVEECQMFLASSYRGDNNEAYFCVLSDRSTLYHRGSSPLQSLSPTVRPLSTHTRSTLDCIIYESEPGMRLRNSLTKVEDMLKIAMHIVKNPKHQLKSFKVAIDVSDATLRHYVRTSNEMWINQLIDFMKLKNYPIHGYTPTAVVTEFHFNLSNAAVDYRPLKLPLRTAVTVDNMNMSCNIAATTPSFLFRIISEELRIFVTDVVSARKVDLKKNYVCAVDTGFIDISFRTSVDEKNEPKLELCATNNIIHIRTCADSFKAFIDLMTYVSINGDMENDQVNDANESAESQDQSENKTAVPDDLHELMAEAMIDCPSISPEDKPELEEISPEEEHFINTDDEFCILEEDPDVGSILNNGEPQIHMFVDEPIVIVENHFSVPPGKTDVLKAPSHYPKPLVLLALREMSLVWQLYGGNDFKSTKKKQDAKDAEEKVKKDVTFADERNVQIDTNNSSIAFCKVTPVAKPFDVNAVQYSLEHVSLNFKGEPVVDNWWTKGGVNRNQDVLMELYMNKVQFQREVYPEAQEYASRYILLVQDIEIKDRLKSSEINKFLYQYSSKKIPKQSHANMIEVKALYTRPDPTKMSEECSLRVTCKPLRLNIDQDSLLFMVDFFQEVLEITNDDSSDDSDSSSRKSNSPNQQQAQSPAKYNSNTNETFYRLFSFAPDVLIRIDYQGKRILMEQGAIYGVLMGLGQLNSSEINLKRLCYRHGLLGYQRVLSYAIGEWQHDIIKNQLPMLLGGVGPMYSFVQLFQGIKDLFYLPVAQYKKDGQIVRGLQRGATSFSTSTVMAFLDLASKLVYAIQGCAIVGCDMVSPGPSVASRYQRSQETYRQVNQPADIREGFATAYNVVKEGLGDTARTIYSVASSEHEHKGVPGAVGGVLRQIPPSLFKPIILGSEAISYVLGSMRHQLMPDVLQEDIHKWRTKNS